MCLGGARAAMIGMLCPPFSYWGLGFRRALLGLFFFFFSPDDFLMSRFFTAVPGFLIKQTVLLDTQGQRGVASL